MLDMAEAVASLGADVLLVLLSDGPLVEEARRRGIPTEVVPLRRAAAGVRRHAALRGAARGAAPAIDTSRRLALVLRRNRIDVLETNSLKAHIVGTLAAQLANIPCVWRLRDIVAPPHLSRVEAMGVKQMSRFADRIVAVSRAAAGSVNHPRVSIEPSAIRFGRFAAVPPLGEGAPRPLRIASISRIAEWKGQDILQDAVSRLDHEGLPVAVVFAGDALFGEEAFRDRLRARASEAMTFVGHVPDVVDVLRNADVVVHTPRLPEPFGKVIVEGMAAGRVVIAPDEAGPAEILEGEFSDWLVRNPDPDAVATKLREVVSQWDSYRRLARRAQVVASHYDVGESAERCLDIYAATVNRVR